MVGLDCERARVEELGAVAVTLGRLQERAVGAERRGAVGLHLQGPLVCLGSIGLVVEVLEHPGVGEPDRHVPCLDVHQLPVEELGDARGLQVRRGELGVLLQRHRVSGVDLEGLTVGAHSRGKVALRARQQPPIRGPHIRPVVAPPPARRVLARAWCSSRPMLSPAGVGRRGGFVGMALHDFGGGEQQLLRGVDQPLLLCACCGSGSGHVTRASAWGGSRAHTRI